MESRLRLVQRLTEQQIDNAIQGNSDQQHINADFVEEEEEEPIDSFSDSEDDHVSNAEEDSDASAEEEKENLANIAIPATVYIGRDGTEWQTSPVSVRRETFRPKKASLNKVNSKPGQNLDTPGDCFHSIIDKQIIDIIVRYTNIEAKNNCPRFQDVDNVEIAAFIGLLIAAGLDRSSKKNYEEFFGILRGMPLFRATMSLRRFKEILQFIRFDDKKTRSVRRSKDKLAAVRAISDLVNKNLTKMYSPGESITINEQLVTLKGRCSFKQYLPKPHKYCLKMFWACDSKTWYPLNGIPYLGRECSGSVRRADIAQQIVIDLCQSYYQTHRNITFDNFFTSYELAQRLQSNGLTCVGKVRKNRKFIPPEFLPHHSRPVEQNVFGFQPNITLLSHVPRHNNAVLFLSTLHHKGEIDDNGMAAINTYYNRTKSDVNVLDQLCHTYSVQRQTNRWPFVYFMNLINVTGIAAFVLWRTENGQIDQPVGRKRKRFLIRLSNEMTYDQIKRRSTANVSSLVRTTIGAVVGNDEGKAIDPLSELPSKRRRCHICPSARDRKVKQLCDDCHRNVCKEHSFMILKCSKCTKQSIIISNDSE